MKGRERRLVSYRVVVGEIAEFLGNRYRPSAASGVVILDDNFNIGQMLFDRRFEITKSDRLQPDVGVVEVLNWRLNKKNFHWVLRPIADSGDTRKFPGDPDRKGYSLPLPRLLSERCHVA